MTATLKIVNADAGLNMQGVSITTSSSSPSYGLVVTWSTALDHNELARMLTIIRDNIITKK